MSASTAFSASMLEWMSLTIAMEVEAGTGNPDLRTVAAVFPTHEPSVRQPTKPTFSLPGPAPRKIVRTMEPTLLVLAAGMGSRYGGLKQIDPVGPDGETILDYSVHDAIACGFGQVVFVIRRDFEEDFREKIGTQFEDRISVGYVFQERNDLPEGFDVPPERTKPWGTAHAVWCARGAVDTPFLAINADDFYGRGAIAAVRDFLAGESVDSTNYCMAGFQLAATLSENGSVSRGICEVNAAGLLEQVREFTKLAAVNGRIIDTASGRPFDGTEFVSMNCWGFTPTIFAGLEELFSEFLTRNGLDEKSEFYIPNAVASLVDSGRASVRVLPVVSQWFGVTYREDRPIVVDALRDMVKNGGYPSPLWR